MEPDPIHNTLTYESEPALTYPGRHDLHLPMHPQIRQVGPGNCPICGMALEPNLSLPDRAKIQNLRICADGSGWASFLPCPSSHWRWADTLPVRIIGLASRRRIGCNCFSQRQLCFGRVGPFFVRGVASVRTGNLNMFTLIAMGTGVAWLYSIVGTLLPDLFPAAMRGEDGAVSVYFEAAAVITVLVLLGQVLELKAREETSGAIRALLDLSPKMARRLRRMARTRM